MASRHEVTDEGFEACLRFKFFTTRKCLAFTTIAFAITFTIFWVHFEDSTLTLKDEIKTMNQTIWKMEFDKWVQDNTIEDLQKEIHDLENGKIQKLEMEVKKTDFHSKASAARTCSDFEKNGIKENGYYLIDPDGRYQGQPSFEVYCEFTEVRCHGHQPDKFLPCGLLPSYYTVPTSARVSPSKAKLKFVGKGHEDFQHEIEYKLKSDQLWNLLRNSGTCKQEIKISCYGMKLHQHGLAHAYWIDKYRRERNFFDGSEITGQKCSCSKEGPYCATKNVTCNCDFRKEGNDDGVISAFWVLPIQGFGYRFNGFAQSTNGTLNVEIGDLVCYDEFSMIVDGKLSDVNPYPHFLLEKTYWQDWDQEFNVKFDIEIFANGEVPKDCILITEMVVVDTKQTFANVSYCAQNQTLEFTVLTRTNGYQSEHFKLEKFDEKVHINWRNANKFIEHAKSDKHWSPRRLTFEYGNMDVSHKTKFTVYGNAKYNETMEISNLAIRKDEIIRPKVYWG